MKRAFTLIELLVVVAIIGLLSSIVLASLNSSRSKGNDARRVSDMREVQKALETYANDNGGNYPSTGGSWRSQCSMDGTYAAQNIVRDNVTGTGIVPAYISQFPADPEMNPTTNTCCFKYTSDGIDYALLDYNCPTSNTSSTALASFKDPVFTSMWSVHTAGAAGKGW